MDTSKRKLLRCALLVSIARHHAQKWHLIGELSFLKWEKLGVSLRIYDQYGVGQAGIFKMFKTKRKSLKFNVRMATCACWQWSARIASKCRMHVPEPRTSRNLKHVEKLKFRRIIHVRCIILNELMHAYFICNNISGRETSVLGGAILESSILLYQVTLWRSIKFYISE